MTMAPFLSRPAARGMSMLELLFVLAISALIIAGITNAVIDVLKTYRARELAVGAQGEGRGSLSFIEREVRQASLGSTLGVIWTQDSAGNVVQRPAVQVFDNVTGTNANRLARVGALDIRVKAGTDALLVVAARTTGAQARVWTREKSVNYDSTQPLYATSTTGFTAAEVQHLLVGPYLSAGWGRVTAILPADDALGLPAGIRIASGGSTNSNIFPNGKMEAGSLIREARARLYFVNDRDELVSVRLAFPRAPSRPEDLLDYELHATGVENMQVECELDAGASFGACPDGVADAEAAWALGAGTPTRLGVGSLGDTRTNVGILRTVTFSVVIRSQSPARDQRGDVPIAIGNQLVPLAPLAYDEHGIAYQLASTDAFLRRAYRVPVAVRNVSLGVY